MDSEHRDGPPTRSEAEIRGWLVAHLAKLIKCDPTEMDIAAPFDRLGLDSATAVGVTLDLEDWLGQSVEPAVFYDYPSVEQLARHLMDRPTNGSAA